MHAMKVLCAQCASSRILNSLCSTYFRLLGSLLLLSVVIPLRLYLADAREAPQNSATIDTNYDCSPHKTTTREERLQMAMHITPLTNCGSRCPAKETT
eukprot:4999108-Amphidinium_carterae.2